MMKHLIAEEISVVIWMDMLLMVIINWFIVNYVTKHLSAEDISVVIWMDIPLIITSCTYCEKDSRKTVIATFTC